METISRATLPLSPWYVTGFLEAESSFTYSRSGMDGKNLVLVFAVKRPAADRALVEEIQNFLGVGRIYEVKPSSLYYRVSHREELDLVVEHFDQFPMRGAKQAGYLLWREMVQLRKQFFRKTPPARLDELARQLSRWANAGEVVDDPALVSLPLVGESAPPTGQP